MNIHKKGEKKKKKDYKQPEMEIVEFDTEDVITTSGEINEDPETTPLG